MGFKIKNLGSPYQTFTANYGPVNLTAGVPDAELYFGLYGRLVLAANAPMGLDTMLAVMDEIIVTRRGETIIDFENGLDLLALEKAPWFDHNISYTTQDSSGHYVYVKGLTLPCAFPPGAAGEFQLSVDYAAVTGITTPYLSVAEGQGMYAHNVFGTGYLAQMLQRNHFHIVKRLYTPAGTGWNNGFDIGTEGYLVGLLVFQTTEECHTVDKDSLSIKELRLEVGGEEVVRTDYTTIYGREGRPGGQSNANAQDVAIDEQDIFDQYFYVDFARQPWDCRGKSVVLYTNAQTADAIRVYPIYLVQS